MGDGDGEGVGGIFGGGWFGESELQAHHFGDLGFFAAAVAGNGSFDESRGVFDDFKARISKAEDARGARLTERHRASRVRTYETSLDGAVGGLVFGGEFADRIPQLDQAMAFAIGRFSTHSAVRGPGAIVGSALDDAPSGGVQAGIDAEDSHAPMVGDAVAKSERRDGNSTRVGGTEAKKPSNRR